MARVSCVDDLFTDNFGTWLAGFIRTPVSSVGTVSLTDITNTGNSVYIYSTGSGSYTFNYYNASLGTRHR